MAEATGTGRAYELSGTGQRREIWRIDRYAWEAYICDDGRHLVCLGGWSEGRFPEAADLAVAFYEDGKLLRSYSTADLIKNPLSVRASVSHYEWRADGMGVGDEGMWEMGRPRLDGHILWIPTLERVLYGFDIATGAIASAHRHPYDRAAPPLDPRERVVVVLRFAGIAIAAGLLAVFGLVGSLAIFSRVAGGTFAPIPTIGGMVMRSPQVRTPAGWVLLAGLVAGAGMVSLLVMEWFSIADRSAAFLFGLAVGLTVGLAASPFWVRARRIHAPGLSGIQIALPLLSSCLVFGVVLTVSLAVLLARFGGDR